MPLKKIEAFVRPGALKKIMLALAEADYPGITVSEVQGHGRQKGVKEHYRDQTTMSLLTKLKIEIVVENAPHAKKIVAAITNAARTGEFGDGKIYVYDVEEGLRIRTGEKGV
jgi:nitrogen regulatory protein P-II 1